jgi:hypothetical protein
MPTILEPSTIRAISEGLTIIGANVQAVREALNRAARAQNPPSRNKPLAQGKPAGSSSKGHATRRGRKAGKVLGKKRGRVLLRAAR